MVGRSDGPPLLPRQAIRIPCRHRHRKKQHGPIQGDRKKKYSRRPNCRHTPTSAPHTPGRPARHSLRAPARFASNKGPGGAKPKTPANTPRKPCAPPFPRSDTARNNAGGVTPSKSTPSTDGRKKPHTGGTPCRCRQMQNQPSPGGVHHLSRLQFLGRAAVSIRLARLQRSGRARTTHRR